MRFYKLPKQIKALNDKIFEKKVKKELEETYNTSMVVRFDHKNNMPDWLVVGGGYVLGVECKNYRSYTGIRLSLIHI